jgi:pimeloyl-ACP methyl ester carboxylesterase
VVKLHTEEHGEGYPLLLITGLGYALWSWQRQIPAWSRRFRVVAIENRGTGRSPKPPGPYSIEEMADDAAEALQGRQAHVAGFSMGGYIAQTLALRHPELVERLVLIGTGTRGPDYLPTAAETISAWEANADKAPADFARATMPLYENGLELARRIPVSEFVQFEGAGHLLFLESPEDFNRTVEEFLS